MEVSEIPAPRTPLGKGMRNASAGFSILEILVGLFLMVLVVLAVSRTTRTSNQVQWTSYYQEQAVSFAQAKMALLQANSLRTVVPGHDSILTPNRFTFARSWIVRDKGLEKQVEVNVSWTASGKAQSVTLTTLIK